MRLADVFLLAAVMVFAFLFASYLGRVALDMVTL